MNLFLNGLRVPKKIFKIFEIFEIFGRNDNSINHIATKIFLINE